MGITTQVLLLSLQYHTKMPSKLLLVREAQPKFYKNLNNYSANLNVDHIHTSAYSHFYLDSVLPARMSSNKSAFYPNVLSPTLVLFGCKYLAPVQCNRVDFVFILKCTCGYCFERLIQTCNLNVRNLCLYPFYVPWNQLNSRQISSSSHFLHFNISVAFLDFT